MEATTTLRPADWARLAGDVAADKQASDIVLLDISAVSGFADYFVILTVDSARQAQVLAQDIEAALKAEGKALYRSEGAAQSGWVLLDFSDVIVHMFLPEQRDFYDIEGVWAHGVETLRVQ